MAVGGRITQAHHRRGPRAGRPGRAGRGADRPGPAVARPGDGCAARSTTSARRRSTSTRPRQALQLLRLRRGRRPVRLRPEDREPVVPGGDRVARRPVRRRGRARGPVARPTATGSTARSALDGAARRRRDASTSATWSEADEARGGARLPGRARHLGRVGRRGSGSASRRPDWDRVARSAHAEGLPAGAADRRRRLVARAGAGRSTASAAGSCSRSATPAAACAASARA